MTASLADDPRPAAIDARARLVLVDDHVILREGLSALLALEADLVVVGEAGSFDEGIALVERLQPDVVITDLAMPRGTGIQVISRVREIAPNTRVLVLTVHSSDEYVDAALMAGADGYVLKDSSRAELLQAIRSVIRGKRYLCAPVSAKIVSGYLGDRDARKIASVQLLTNREREILTLVAHGMSNKRIALRLILSVKTIEKHRSNFMRKLGLHNTAGITMFAISKGLASPDEGTLHAYP
jgi:DNA-binding NarL/FixJ family response regulator